MSFKRLLFRIILSPYTFFLVIATFYFLNIFKQLDKDQFLLIHDHFIWINIFHSDNELFMRVKDNFAYNTGVSLSISYLYNLFYRALFMLGVTLQKIELIGFTLLTFFGLSLSYYGFKKIAEHYHMSNSKILLILITFFYIIGPFGTMSINTGNFWAISFVLSYATLPYLMYWNLRLLNMVKPDVYILLLYTLVIRLTFNYVPFAIPVAFSCISFWVYRIHKYGVKQFIRDITIMVIFFLVLYFDSIIAYSIDAFTNPLISRTYGLLDATFPLLQGGFSPIFGSLYSWALYTEWTPKIILSYAGYYNSKIFLFFSYSVIAIAIYGLVKKKSEILKTDLIHIYIAFFVSAFFFKGAQPPLGGLYSWLITNIPVFISIRSPDSKFAAIISVSLAVILLYLSKYFRKTPYLIGVFITVFVLSIPILNGEAVLGGAKGYYKYRFSNDDLNVIEYLRSQDDNPGIISIPSYNLVETIRSDGSIVVGKDLIALSVRQPFLYLNNRYTIPMDLSKGILELYNSFDHEILQRYPVSHLLYRKNAYGPQYKSILEKMLLSLSEEYDPKLVIENSTYKLYKLNYVYYPFAKKINNATFYYKNEDKKSEIDVYLPQNASNYWLAFSKDTAIPILRDSTVDSGVFPTLIKVSAGGAENIYLVYYPDIIYKTFFYITRICTVVLLVLLYKNRKVLNNG